MKKKPTKKIATELRQKSARADAVLIVALADAIWSAAKSLDLEYRDLMRAVGILVVQISKNTEEPVETVLAEAMRVTKSVKV